MARTIHVSQSGDDDGDGSRQRPVRTLIRANEFLAIKDYGIDVSTTDCKTHWTGNYFSEPEQDEK